MSFIPRSKFIYPLHTPSWYAGHMATSIRRLPAILEEVDLVIEARDARLPLTSINTAFDAALTQAWGPVEMRGGERLKNPGGGKGKGKAKESEQEDVLDEERDTALDVRVRDRLIVYTKRDLADEMYEESLKKAFRENLGQKVMFADTRVDTDVKRVLRHAVRLAKLNKSFVPDTKVLVVGMPNVGKSSLLNALRRVGMNKGKAFAVSPTAGETRKLTGIVRIFESPNIYVYDTPGVMVPFLGHGEAGSERGLKIALTGGMKDDLFEREVVVDYLLWRMNRRMVDEEDLEGAHKSYIESLGLSRKLEGPTDDIQVLLDAVARRIGALKKGGETNPDSAEAHLLHAFREGKLGRFTLDSFDAVPEINVLDVGRNVGVEREGTVTLDGIGNAVQEGSDGMANSAEEASTLQPESTVTTLEARKVEPQSEGLTTTTAPPSSGPSSHSENRSSPPTPSSKKIPSAASLLDARVSFAVRQFLATNEENAALAEDGKGLSISQNRKIEKRENEAKRNAKQKSTSSFSSSRGGFGARGGSRGRGRGRGKGRGELKGRGGR